MSIDSFRYTRHFGAIHSAHAGDNGFLSIERVRHVAPAIFAEAPHESRSARYGFVPTERLLGGLISEGFRPVSVIQAKSRDGGNENSAKHLIRFRHENSEMVDGIYPEVVLLNSHDGSTAYRLMAGLFRMVCANGLIAGEMWGDCKVPHKANALDHVIEGSYQIIKEAPALLSAVEEMSAVTLMPGEQYAFNKAALALRYENLDEAPINPAMVGTTRRRDDFGPDLWRTMNRAQENLIRGGLHGRKQDENGRMRTTTTREIRGIDQTVSINRGLWVLAEEMRRLKAAA
jgi:hypothetical protein